MANIIYCLHRDFLQTGTDITSQHDDEENLQEKKSSPANEENEKRDSCDSSLPEEIINDTAGIISREQVFKRAYVIVKQFWGVA